MSNIQIQILYANDEGATFDIDYYLSHHMPLVAKEFKEFGLEGYDVLKLVSPDPSKTLPYSYQATLYFKNPEDFQKALQAKGGPVMGDVPNFSNRQPTVWIGEKKAQE